MTAPREQRRRQRLELGREHILDAAEDVYARKGFHDASMKEIADGAEFSVGALYGFFENKDDLFRHVYRRRGAQFMQGMREVLAGQASPRRQLHDLADFQVRFFREHPQFGRLFLRTSGVNLPEPERGADEAITENYTEAMALQAKLFRAGQDAGELRDGDPEVLAMLFSGLVSAFQATDPVVVAEAAPGDERMPLGELHDILDGAFTPYGRLPATASLAAQSSHGSKRPSNSSLPSVTRP
jgi:AcrR family transcriptional regulator